MKFAVFLRAANVGGRNTMAPAALAKELAAMEVKSLGAAGTFVVGKATSAAAVRKTFAARVPASCDVIVRPLAEVAELVARDPLAEHDSTIQRHVTILATTPTKQPKLPIDAPAAGRWQVRVVAIEGPYALSLRDAEPGRFYPNEILEEALGVRATTRGWKTMQALAKASVTPP